MSKDFDVATYRDMGSARATPTRPDHAQAPEPAETMLLLDTALQTIARSRTAPNVFETLTWLLTKARTTLAASAGEGRTVNGATPVCAKCGGLASCWCPVSREGEGVALRPDVLAFAQAMERKLRKHDAERGDSWQAMDPVWLRKRIVQEHVEFLEAAECVIARPWPEGRPQVRDEAADVANFLMFFCSNVGAIAGSAPAAPVREVTEADEELLEKLDAAIEKAREMGCSASGGAEAHVEGGCDCASCEDAELVFWALTDARNRIKPTAALTRDGGK